MKELIVNKHSQQRNRDNVHTHLLYLHGVCLSSQRKRCWRRKSDKLPHNQSKPCLYVTFAQAATSKITFLSFPVLHLAMPLPKPLLCTYNKTQYVIALVRNCTESYLVLHTPILVSSIILHPSNVDWIHDKDSMRREIFLHFLSIYFQAFVQCHVNNSIVV